MKNYAVLADLKAKATFHIEKAFDRGYDQGFNDCHSELTEEEAKCHYQEGYNDGYRKGVERGKEARVAEADCAYQCGMRKAWEVARKIYDIRNIAMVKELFGADANYTIHNFTASEVIEKIEAWEKKQEQTEKNCNNCKYGGNSREQYPCKTCITLMNAFANWTPKQDAPEMNVESIEVGDEVRMIGSDPKLDNCDYGVCTMVKPKTIYVMRMDGSVGEEDKEEWEKTGNHYDIQSILDKMKENEVKE